MAKKYQQLIKEKGSRAAIKGELTGEILFKVGPGLYSEKRTISTLEYLVARYPHAIFCSFSAFFYHGMTNVIPESYFLAIERTKTRIKGRNVTLSFYSERFFKIGLTSLSYNGLTLPVYDRERLLIDLIRFKAHFDSDYYKTIIVYYRNHIDEIDTIKLEEYVSVFDKSDYIRNAIYSEVY